MKHDLHLYSETNEAKCSCGEVFTGFADDILSDWNDHIELGPLMQEARDHALQERASRAAGEEAIRRLTEFGLSDRTVSSIIGNDAEGNLMVSPTLVQRLRLNELVKHPRRRHRK